MVLKIIFFIVVFVALVGAAAVFFGKKHWQGATERLHMKMEAARVPVTSQFYDPRELDGLPGPVQRYFRAVLNEGQPLVTALSMEHTGTFNMSETGEQWKPFTSTQRVVTRRPGFVWDARIHVAPAMTVFVHDAYVAGGGVLTARLAGLVTLMQMPATAELARGELMRFLAEGAWYPTALLPGQGVTWQAVDDVSATAALRDGETALALLFRFNEKGLIESVRAEARGRTVAGRIIPTPWEVRLSNYAVRGGMLIPLEGEVAWVLPEGLKPYWRGRITKLGHEFSQ